MASDDDQMKLFYYKDDVRQMKVFYSIVGFITGVVTCGLIVVLMI